MVRTVDVLTHIVVIQITLAVGVLPAKQAHELVKRVQRRQTETQ